MGSRKTCDKFTLKHMDVSLCFRSQTLERSANSILGGGAKGLVHLNHHPSPTPYSRLWRSRGGAKGPPFRFRHANPLKFQGPKSRPSGPWGQARLQLKTAEAPAISIRKGKFKFLHLVLSGLPPQPPPAWKVPFSKPTLFPQLVLPDREPALGLH